MKVLSKIGKIIAALILVPTVLLCAVILFFAVTGRKFPSVAHITSKEKNIETQESKTVEETQEIRGYAPEESKGEQSFILDTSAFLIHLPDCTEVQTIIAENKMELVDTKEALEAGGFSACEKCKP